jgi:hypothetical protein
MDMVTKNLKYTQFPEHWARFVPVCIETIENTVREFWRILDYFCLECHPVYKIDDFWKKKSSTR